LFFIYDFDVLFLNNKLIFYPYNVYVSKSLELYQEIIMPFIVWQRTVNDTCVCVECHRCVYLENNSLSNHLLWKDNSHRKAQQCGESV
jgi:hypothetical protein